MQTAQIAGAVFAVLGFVVSLAAAAHATLNKRRPQSAFAWIAIAFMLPFAGALLYWLFGINRVRARAQRLNRGNLRASCGPLLEAAPPLRLEPLARLGAAVTHLPLVGGNAVTPLHNGEQTFPEMLAAIHGAQQRAFLSTYIFDSGPLGQDFVAALADAARRGVDARVLLDGVGELYSMPRVRASLRNAGVRFARFVPPRLVPPSFSVNLRNHRKVLVVDGQTAFTGGINIREHYLARSRDHGIVDVHFKIEGPVAAEIEAVFVRDWSFVTGESTTVVPVASPARGAALCRVVADGPDDDLDRLTELFVGAIGHARKRVAIMTPYFLPPRELITPLQAAALAGVDVAVILPAKNNLPYVHRATRHMLWEILQRGVKIYYQPPPFVHSKLFYIDDDYAQVGSANLDPRSLRLNFELNVEVYDPGTVASLSDHFEATRARSRQIMLEDVDERPLPTKLVDGVAWLFSPYL